jgi:hypothetical protein
MRIGPVLLGAVFMVLVARLTAGPAGAADLIEAIGAEKCGGPVRSYEVEFLAPETAELEATVKALVGGSAVTRREPARLSLDGKACADARCGFRASKGQTYKLVAETELTRLDELCIVVARP